MKKNVRRGGRFAEILAVFCAAALMIQAVPTRTVISANVDAAETPAETAGSGETSGESQYSDAEEAESKKEKDEEERREEENKETGGEDLREEENKETDGEEEEGKENKEDKGIDGGEEEKTEDMEKEGIEKKEDGEEDKEGDREDNEEEDRGEDKEEEQEEEKSEEKEEDRKETGEESQKGDREENKREDEEENKEESREEDQKESRKEENEGDREKNDAENREEDGKEVGEVNRAEDKEGNGKVEKEEGKEEDKEKKKQEDKKGNQAGEGGEEYQETDGAVEKEGDKGGDLKKGDEKEVLRSNEKTAADAKKDARAGAEFSEQNAPEETVIACAEETPAEKPTKTKKIELTARDSGESGYSGIRRMDLCVRDSSGGIVYDAEIQLTDNSGSNDGIRIENRQILRENSDQGNPDGNAGTTSPEPASFEEAEAFRTLAAEVVIGGRLTGTYRLEVTAWDYCENSRTTIRELTFDNTAPACKIVLDDTSDGSAVERNGETYWYYGAIRGEGLKVTFADLYLTAEGGEYSVTLKNADEAGGAVTKTLDLSDAAQASEDSLPGGTVSFGAAEIKALKDGRIHIEVTAKDAAGNIADRAAEVTPQALRRAADPDPEFSFVLDTTPPVLTQSDTETEKAPGYDAGCFYYSRQFVTTVTIADDNINENSFTFGFSGTEDQNAADAAVVAGDPVLSTDTQGNTVCTNSFTGKECPEEDSGRDPDGSAGARIGSLQISGKDFAGNALTVSDCLASAGEENQDSWKKSGECTAATDCEREMCPPPVAEIRYTQIDKKHVLESEKTAYYKEQIEVRVTFRNVVPGEVEYAADGDSDLPYMLSVRREDSSGNLTGCDVTTQKKEIDHGRSTLITVQLPYSADGGKDGAYRILLRGRNKAGTAVRVREWKPYGNGQEGKIDTEELEELTFLSAYTLVLDTMSPVAVMKITPAEGVKNKELNQAYGSRYYFNGKHTLAVEVRDASFHPVSENDLLREYVTLRYAQKTAQKDSSAETFKKTDFKNDLSLTWEKGVLTYVVPASERIPDGIRQYLLAGEDFAGNRIVPASGQEGDPAAGSGADLEGGSSVPASGQAGEAAAGSGAGPADGEAGEIFTAPVVTDTVKPQVWLKITEQAVKEKDDLSGVAGYYTMKPDGSVPSCSPYRPEKSATIIAYVESGEKTPCALSFSEVFPNEKEGAENPKRPGDSNFRTGKALTDTIFAPRVFCIDNCYAVDLAGNISAPKYSPDIYLDPDAPRITDNEGKDTLAPSIEIEAHIHTDNWDNDGMPLFNCDVPFSVSVKDEPYADGNPPKSTGSSGLKTVDYRIYRIRTRKDGINRENIKKESAGKESVTEERVIREKVLQENEKPVYEYDGEMTGGVLDESKFVFRKDFEAVVNAEQCNYNALCLVVTAVDNAGNTSESAFRFGIDRTAPRIELKYDNNAAKNGMYFKKGRTACITVTERNFDENLFSVVVRSSLDGTTVKDAGKYTAEGWEYIPAENSGDGNGDEDRYVYKVTFDNDGDYELEIAADSAGGALKEKTASYAVVDRAGNPAALTVARGTRAPHRFVIDRTAPNMSVTMVRRAPDKEDGEYYYNADNCGIMVRFDDNGHNFGMKGGTYTVTIDGNRAAARAVTTGDGVTHTTAQIVYTSGELAKGGRRLLQDGRHEIRVVAIDAAGNAAEYLTTEKSGYNTASRGCRFTEKGGKLCLPGVFVLDTERPRVDMITTKAAESCGDRGYPFTDSQVYPDTNSVYYNTDVTVTIAVTDRNLRPSQFEGSVYRGGEEEPSVNAVLTKTGTGLTAEYTLSYTPKGNNRFRNLTLRGQDKAGNPLLLVTDRSDARCYRQDSAASGADDLRQTAVQSKNGAVTALHGKVIDKEPPEAVILYTSADRPNMYEGETPVRNRSSAYYNRPVSVRISFKDNLELDGKKLYAGEEGKEITQKTAKRTAENGAGTPAVKEIVKEIRITKDGRGAYTAYGTDRALNPTVVTEKAPDADPDAAGNNKKTYGDHQRTAGAFNAKMTKQSAFVPMYEIVLDQTAPTFAMTVDSPGSASQTLNPQGKRYYFNKAYTAAVRVDEDNYDSDRITVRKGSVTGDSYNSETAEINRYPAAVLPLKKNPKLFRDRESGDGVYRYVVYGSDKAGNALVPSAKENLEGTVSLSEEKENSFGEAEAGLSGEKGKGSGEKTADFSFHIAVDRRNPAGTLRITAGKAAVYEMDRYGNVVFAEPYRAETKAAVLIAVDGSVERSPVNIYCRIDSTKDSDRKEVRNQEYKYDNSVKAEQDGRQIFRVVEYVFTDLAGNVTKYGMENKIYLDEERPDVDSIAPAISVAAYAKPGMGGSGGGQPLFRSDVELSIHISDPDSEGSSSGIGEVKYTINTGGSPEEKDVLIHGKTAIPQDPGGGHYEDPALEYTFVKNVQVSAGKHNTNNNEIIVTASDNAGNTREARYYFGIDVTAPAIAVEYDNNNALNGEYFKDPRVATVTVTERNFDSSKFRISTESGASVSGWSHTGNGGSGDRDQWTTKVTFARDGNYTLTVSGEDMVGNRADAGGIVYRGAAPRKFTIDRTMPSVTVTYDNNDVRNEKYYKAARTAVIRVNDMNFAGMNDILVQSGGGGSAPASVTFNGDAAAIHFEEDGVYMFNGSVTDKAGNRTEIPVQTEFIIDTKKPVLIFEDEKPFKLQGADAGRPGGLPVNGQFFSGEDFVPAVTVMDRNCSVSAEDAVFEIIGTKAWNHYLARAKMREDDSTKFDMEFGAAVFRVEEKIDDVYHVRASARDLAGNESGTVEFDFSINRFGSSYRAADDSTFDFIRNVYYHNRAQDLVIHEYNTNAIKKGSSCVEVMKDGNTATVRKLTPGTDYDFKEDSDFGSRKGGRIYKYTIHKSVFEEEGDYSVIITSEDEAGHRNTTSRVHRGVEAETGETKLFVDAFPIEFVIDRTPPVNRLGGVGSEKKQPVNAGSLMLDVYPEDAQTAVGRVEIRRWESDSLGFSAPDGAPLSTHIYAFYDGEHPQPEDTEKEKYGNLQDYTDEMTDRIRIRYELTESRNWQWVEIITTDLAGNESTDIREGGTDAEKGITYVENRRGFLVTTNAFSQLINNAAARAGAGTASVLALLFLIFRKKKRHEKQQ
ncbi:MAG: hypothetical protein Q4D81_02700 [Eubacteriales bacterium]|nr:hypothetical protein [Eubacteriales bacterium]